MAKLKNLLDPEQSHKAIGGVVYNTRFTEPQSRFGRMDYAGVCTSPTRHIPQSQRLAQARLQSLILTSKELTIWQISDWQMMKWFWEEYNWFDEVKRITWLDFFIKFNTQRLRLGLEVLMDAPIYADRPSNVEGFTLTPVINGIRCTWTPPPAENSVDLWLGYRQTSTSKADIHHARARVIVSGDGTPHTITGLMSGFYHVHYRVLGEGSGMPSTWASLEGHVT